MDKFGIGWVAARPAPHSGANASLKACHLPLHLEAEVLPSTLILTFALLLAPVLSSLPPPRLSKSAPPLNPFPLPNRSRCTLSSATTPSSSSARSRVSTSPHTRRWGRPTAPLSSSASECRFVEIGRNYLRLCCEAQLSVAVLRGAHSPTPLSSSASKWCFIKAGHIHQRLCCEAQVSGALLRWGVLYCLRTILFLNLRPRRSSFFLSFFLGALPRRGTPSPYLNVQWQTLL